MRFILTFLVIGGEITPNVTMKRQFIYTTYIYGVNITLTGS